MKVTSFKSVPAYTPQYRRVMSLVGKCISQGGHVVYSHNYKNDDKDESVIDVDLHW